MISHSYVAIDNHFKYLFAIDQLNTCRNIYLFANLL